MKIFNFVLFIVIDAFMRVLMMQMANRRQRQTTELDLLDPTIQRRIEETIK